MYWGALVVDPNVGATLLGWNAEIKNLLKMDLGTVVLGHGSYLYTRKDIEEFVKSLDLLTKIGNDLIEQGVSLEEFAAV